MKEIKFTFKKPESRLSPILIIIFFLVLWKFGFIAAVLIGILFVFLNYNLDSRILAGLGLALLSSCLLFVLLDKEDLAEEIAIYAYYFLIMAVVSQVKEYALEYKNSEALGAKDDVEESIGSIIGNIIKKPNRKTVGLISGAVVIVLAALVSLYIYFIRPVDIGPDNSQELAVNRIDDNVNEDEEATDEEAKDLFSDHVDKEEDDIIVDTQIPTSTVAIIPKSDIEIIILNGSGITGAATELKDKMSEQGFNIISVDDADKFDYETTIIKYAAGSLEKAKTVEEYLKKSYKTEMRAVTELETDVEIILGNEPASEEIAEEESKIVIDAQIPTSTEVIILKSDIDIIILNGSGISGEAGELKEKMGGQGFNIVRTGNADNFNYKKTIINFSAANHDKAKMVEDYLGADYEIEMLEEEVAGADVIIILGAK